MELTGGERLKMAREYHTPKMTQAKLSALLGIDRTVLAKYETKRATLVPPHILMSAAKALGLREEYFMDAQVDDTPLRYRVEIPWNGMAPITAGERARGTKSGLGRRLFPVLGSAGASVYPLSPGDDPDDWVEFSDELYDRHRDQFAIRVWGDSAEPDMRHGDFVLVVKEPNFQLSGFFVVAKSPDNGFVVKVCSTVKDGLELRSVNSKYDPVVVGAGWEMIGFAVGWRRDRGLGVYLEAGDKTGLRPGFRE